MCQKAIEFNSLFSLVLESYRSCIYKRITVHYVDLQRAHNLMEDLKRRTIDDPGRQTGSGKSAKGLAQKSGIQPHLPHNELVGQSHARQLSVGKQGRVQGMYEVMKYCKITLRYQPVFSQRLQNELVFHDFSFPLCNYRTPVLPTEAPPAGQPTVSTPSIDLTSSPPPPIILPQQPACARVPPIPRYS
ncbi:uncharacterized protein CIMG_13333 [Coccidioides immitis RS]|uniref:Uncharacterized protein n=1 Tax=Coccidioides immitis (strain RS) TaxID=246410 RepID=J3K3G4_COCIM|nr:uncharacterized protein CIMG_13333 [Coccidioides immitis RS]EAS28727.3 hypothetical protein CIMG_13333 [Coccidioides immitis RS]